MNLEKKNPQADKAWGKYHKTQTKSNLPLSILELNRPLPNDLEAEAGLLSACLADPTAVDRASELIEPSDFYRRGHEIIFKRLVEMRKNGKWYTPTSILLSFSNQPEYEQFEETICDLGPFITGQTSRHFAGMVRDFSRKRQVAIAGMRVIENAYAVTADVDEILSQATADFASIRQSELK